MSAPGQIYSRFNIGMPKNSENITIGIAIHNDERFVRRAIESAVDQAGRIIIADDASDCGTEKLCRSIASQYKHVEYKRHASRIGSVANFAFCLDTVSTPYFMWIGGHDFISRDCVSVLQGTLDENPDVVLAYGDAGMVDEDGELVRVNRRFAKRALSSSPTNRVLAMLEEMDWDGSIIYGMHRTEAIGEAWPKKPIYGPDLIALVRLAIRGKIMHVDSAKPLSFQKLRSPDNTPDAYMKRVGGNIGQSSPLDMCDLLFKIAAGVSVSSFPRKVRYLIWVSRALSVYGWTFGSFVGRKLCGSVTHQATGVL